MSEINKADFVADLSRFSHLLKNKYKLPGEFKNLFSLEGKLNNPNDFDIMIKDIRFEIEGKKVSGTIPESISDFVIIFSNTCKFKIENIALSKDVIGEIDGDYCFQIDIEGYDENCKLYHACWHLDKNIKSNPPKYTHPFYHLQFGGDTLEGKDSGELLLLGSPRIPHPPMDLFLGIHFIINNFFSSKDYPWVKEILNDGEYQEIIVRAQNRMWKPYFSAFNEDNNHNDFHLNNIFPLYIS